MGRNLSESLTPRSHAESSLRHTNLSLQLAAIKAFIHRNYQADAATKFEINELSRELDSRPDSDQLYADYEVRFWNAVFQEAAHSMSAVGTLAPFIEALFIAIFAVLRERQNNEESDDRRKRSDDQYWNPQTAFSKDGSKTNFVIGVQQLVKACGLKSYLPDDYYKSLSALFAYRNKMLHIGFEWPETDVKNFAQQIASNQWPEDWFSCAYRNGEPWLYYMSPKFCDLCIEMIDGVIDGFGKFLRDQILTVDINE